MEYKKPVLSLLWLVLSLYGTMVIGNYATCRDIEDGRPPIYDLLHDNNIRVPVLVVDIMLGLMNGGLSIYIIYLLRYNLEKGLLLINNISLIYSLRILTILFTAFPNSKICETYCADNYFTEVRTDFCGDIMFSGHTSTVFIFILYFTEEIKNMYIKTAFFIFQGIYSALIVLSRIHYTDDVLIALIITYMIYRISSTVK